ncbi:hypothetical protein IWT140_02036 [Secundilactobacillus pentosiphilus]|uniref:DUF2187 domain-containing protein n=1 Tax=Secundilactobacillus pentosiphilus TaxID=1714682 RepID=A0A1Z5IS08_9LACO|nr:hypothetical protein [Secundilactobacillus pentosiphilus]GAX04398.1 hypothetical protein IWT140_02036 [Secundilactobacillus pentosiphilus]GAX05642.1 hypothetical protein IWT25_00967 [Secundilactobacillus pentosiphilus]
MIKINDIVTCEPNGNLTCSFVGRVEHIYERTVMVTVMDHHPSDRFKVAELMGRVVVAKSKVKTQAETAVQKRQVAEA